MPIELQNRKTASKRETRVLVASIFIAGLCSIIYELLIGTTSSYFLGDSVKHFSLTIGFYMAAMGLGSFLSRVIRDENLLAKFIAFEILLGFMGGISVPVLYFAFAYTSQYPFVMFLFTILIGVLIGLEIPLLTRVMQKYYTLRINLSNVLTLDYLGALIATLLFPFILLPLLGTFKSSLFFGLVNMCIGFLNLWCFADELGFQRKKLLKWANISVFLFLSVMLFSSQYLLSLWTSNLYQDRVIYSKESPYQHIVLTKDKEDIRLFLDGNLQFSSIDEYRYHESLVHIPLGLTNAKNILLLGGGDGFAVREILKHSSVESITLVDLDPQITELGLHNPHISKLNQKSLHHNKVNIINQDAFLFLNNSSDSYDVIIGDLPDPNNTSLSRLYSQEFFRLNMRRLNKSGIFLTQATSPFYARKAFWCITDTIKSAGFSHVAPFHVNIPSFGEWGFVLASNMPLQIESITLPENTRFIEDKIVQSLFIFEKDLLHKRVSSSTLDKPIILSYYLDSWRHWN